MTIAELADRELLELAAKAANAAGAHIVQSYENYDMVDAESDCDWNPIKDDGDALRLAVKLKMAIHIDDGITDIVSPDDSGTVEAHLGDPCVATRRAIVRAAARIGAGQNI